MTELFLSASVFPLVLTLGAFQLGLWLQKKTKSTLCNPILVGAVVVIGVLLALDYPNADYQAGCGGISWLLTPATICLAVPLYEQVQVLKKNLKAILVGVTAGTAACLGCILGLSVLFGLDRTMTVSLLPKSITTAMGLALSQQLGGVPAITTAVILLTGAMGSLAGTVLCKVFRITDPIAVGVAFGTGAHVIGTSRATELSPLSGAVSSLSLVVAGILTTVICPLLV